MVKYVIYIQQYGVVSIRNNRFKKIFFTYYYNLLQVISVSPPTVPMLFNYLSIDLLVLFFEYLKKYY